MTDIDKFVALYKSFGIDCKINIDENGKFICLAGPSMCPDIEITNSDKFEGYGCFHSIVNFTADGKFVRQGFWE